MPNSRIGRFSARISEASRCPNCPRWRRCSGTDGGRPGDPVLGRSHSPATPRRSTSRSTRRLRSRLSTRQPAAWSALPNPSSATTPRWRPISHQARRLPRSSPSRRAGPTTLSTPGLPPGSRAPSGRSAQDSP